MNFTLRQPKGLQGAHWPHPSFSIAAHDAMTDTGLGWPGLAFLWKKKRLLNEEIYVENWGLEWIGLRVTLTKMRYHIKFLNQAKNWTSPTKKHVGFAWFDLKKHYRQLCLIDIDVLMKLGEKKKQTYKWEQCQTAGCIRNSLEDPCVWRQPIRCTSIFLCRSNPVLMI